MYNVYYMRGLRVVKLNTDKKIACIEESIRPVRLNVEVAEEYVGEVERSMRTVK